jgi:hypothetical protein
LAAAAAEEEEIGVGAKPRAMLPSGEYFLGRPLFFLAAADDASMLKPGCLNGDDPSKGLAFELVLLLLWWLGETTELKGNRLAEGGGIIAPELGLIIWLWELLLVLLLLVFGIILYEWEWEWEWPIIMFGCGVVPGGGPSRESIFRDLLLGILWIPGKCWE